MNALHSKRGLSALELLAASVVLALALVPLLTLTGGSAREAGFSEAHVIAHARAFSLLDCQEALGFEALFGVSEQTSDLPIPATARALPPMAGLRFSERLTARRLADGLMLITVEVSWQLPTDRSTARPHVVRTVRMLSRPDGSWIRSAPLPRRESMIGSGAVTASATPG